MFPQRLFTQVMRMSAVRRTAFTRSFGSSVTAIPSIERLADHQLPHAQWADYRPNLVEVSVTRNAEGDLVGKWGGEDVIFPELDNTLEWVLSTPVDTHLFEEVPIVKECPEDD